jgi:hypothetical protein
LATLPIAMSPGYPASPSALQTGIFHSTPNLPAVSNADRGRSTFSCRRQTESRHDLAPAGKVTILVGVTAGRANGTVVVTDQAGLLSILAGAARPCPRHALLAPDHPDSGFLSFAVQLTKAAPHGAVPLRGQQAHAPRHRLAGLHSVGESDWARAAYQQARGRGQQHNRALRGVGACWVRILWRCWTDHTLYYPAPHLKDTHAS